MVIVERSALVAVLFLIASYFLIACDTSEPGDASEYFATRIDIELRESTTSQVFVSSIQGDDGFMAGADYQADTLRVEPGRMYIGRLRFFDANGEEVTQSIWQEAEHHQFFYTLTGVENLALTVVDVESNYGANEIGGDLPVGLAFEINTVDGVFVESGKLRIIMGDYASNQKNGITLPEKPIADVEVPVRIENLPEAPEDPKAPEAITKAVLSLARSDASVVWTITAIDPEGLAYEDYELPDSLRIEECSKDNSGATVCSDADALGFTAGDYQGHWDLSNADTGQNFTAEVLTEGQEHQFFYRVNFGTSNITILDQDSDGLPIGMSFDISVPTNVGGSGHFNIQLGHFMNDIKTGSAAAQLKDVQFRFPFEIR